VDDITLENTEDLKYLKACMLESSRLYPSVIGALPRIVPHGGATICGRFVAEGSVVGIWHWAAYHSDQNFNGAEKFRPERWLGEVEKRESKTLRPFSFGPRACVAKE
jgi:cytochrome P450